MRFDLIVVPRGAEARAVERGWPAPRPEIRQVAAGIAAGDGVIDGRLTPTVLVLGLCGAVDPVLRVGDAVVYARICDGSDTIELDAQLTRACAAACGTVPVAAACVDRVIGGVAAKAALRAATGAAVIDMEAAAIARACRDRGVRLGMVRIVSDDADSELPDLSGVYDAQGALRPVALAAALVRRPLRGVRFVRNALRALGELRAAAAVLANAPSSW